MSRAVVDTSALVALLIGEPGSDFMKAAGPGYLLSVVNLAETIDVLMRKGLPFEAALRAMEIVDIEIADFDRALAEDTGALAAITKRLGLSFGDRACLALARREKLPVFTADRAWRDLDIGVEIRLIR